MKYVAKIESVEFFSPLITDLDNKIVCFNDVKFYCLFKIMWSLLNKNLKKLSVYKNKLIGSEKYIYAYYLDVYTDIKNFIKDYESDDNYLSDFLLSFNYILQKLSRKEIKCKYQFTIGIDGVDIYFVMHFKKYYFTDTMENLDEIIKFVHKNIINTRCEVGVSFLNKNLDEVLIYESFYINNIIEFLKKFNNVDEMIFYIINNYHNIKKEYENYYDLLAWRKYKI